jgi:hypothetical protein
MYDFSTSYVLCIWIYGNTNDDDDDSFITALELATLGSDKVTLNNAKILCNMWP